MDMFEMAQAHIKAHETCQIERIEDALLGALKAGVAGRVKVDAFPAQIAEYDFAGLDAAALVHFMGARFTARQGPHTHQSQRLNFAIILLTRDLRSHRGAYRTLEDIRLALQGASFEGAGPCEMVSSELIAEIEGQWRWQIVIGLDAPAVARIRRAPAALMNPVTTTS